MTYSSTITIQMRTESYHMQNRKWIDNASQVRHRRFHSSRSVLFWLHRVETFGKSSHELYQRYWWSCWTRVADDIVAWQSLSSSSVDLFPRFPSDEWQRCQMLGCQRSDRSPNISRMWLYWWVVHTTGRGWHCCIDWVFQLRQYVYWAVALHSSLLSCRCLPLRRGSECLWEDETK